MTYGHDGWFPGYLTTVLYFPDHRTSIAFQVNTDNQRELGMPLARLANSVAALLFTTP